MKLVPTTASTQRSSHRSCRAALGKIVGATTEVLWRNILFEQHDESFEFRIFGLGLFQDRDVGVGVFPQC